MQPIDCRLSPHTWACRLAAKQPHAALVYRLMVSTLVIHVIIWITNHLPTPKGRRAELAWLVDASGQFTHKVVTCQPQIRHRPGKVCQPKTDVLTTEPSRHPRCSYLMLSLCLIHFHTIRIYGSVQLYYSNGVKFIKCSLFIDNIRQSWTKCVFRSSDTWGMIA